MTDSEFLDSFIDCQNAGLAKCEQAALELQQPKYLNATHAKNLSIVNDDSCQLDISSLIFPERISSLKRPHMLSPSLTPRPPSIITNMPIQNLTKKLEQFDDQEFTLPEISIGSQLFESLRLSQSLDAKDKSKISKLSKMWDIFADTYKEQVVATQARAGSLSTECDSRIYESQPIHEYHSHILSPIARKAVAFQDSESIDASQLSENRYPDEHMSVSPPHTPEKRQGHIFSTGKFNLMLETITEYVAAKHAYQAMGPTEMSLNEGEEVKIIRVDGDWIYGSKISNNKQVKGWIPYSYVE